jgi:hypothetical protein
LWRIVFSPAFIPEEDASQSDVDAVWRDEIGTRVDDIPEWRGVELGTFQQARDKPHALLDDLRK